MIKEIPEKREKEIDIKDKIKEIFGNIEVPEYPEYGEWMEGLRPGEGEDIYNFI